jgi:hypothetical protein
MYSEIKAVPIWIKDSILSVMVVRHRCKIRRGAGLLQASFQILQIVNVKTEDVESWLQIRFLIDDGEIKISIGKMGARGATINDSHIEGGGIEIYQTLSVRTYDCEMTYSWHSAGPFMNTFVGT